MLIIFIILLLVLILPSHIVISYSDSLSVKLKLLYISIKLFPFPFKITKKLNKKVNIDKKSDPENKLRETLDNKGFFKNLKSLNKILGLSNEVSKKILRHIKINLIDLTLGVQGCDASEIAVKYGQCQILISNIVSRLNSISSVKKCRIIIYPDFIGTGKSIKFKIDIYSRAIFIIYELLVFSNIYAKMKNELK